MGANLRNSFNGVDCERSLLLVHMIQSSSICLYLLSVLLMTVELLLNAYRHVTVVVYEG